MDKKIKTTTMGELLLEEFMQPLGISAYRLAHDINVPVSRIQDILHDRRKISVDTALRLAHYFNLSEKYFINIQNDIEIRETKIKLSGEIESIPQYQYA